MNDPVNSYNFVIFVPITFSCALTYTTDLMHRKRSLLHDHAQIKDNNARLSWKNLSRTLLYIYMHICGSEYI